MAIEKDLLKPHLPSIAEPVIGIDLGTTNSLVAFVKNGVPTVLENQQGERLVPSVLALDQDGHWVIGSKAKLQKILQPGQTFYSVKRLLGKRLADLGSLAHQLPYRMKDSDRGVLLQVGTAQFEREISPIELSAQILKRLKSIAEAALGQEIKRAVITVPAYFNDSQRQATRAAGRLAGLEVLRMINEPTAAALAYGLGQKKESLIAVYDFGGGTFDVSILKLHGGIFEVLATNGDTQLGGDDIDQVIVEQMLKEVTAETPQKRAELLDAAEKIKINFSMEDRSQFLDRELNISEFESWIEPILQKTKAPCFQALKDAGLKAADLNDVILVGGPTRLKAVQKMAEAIFGKAPNTSVHPEEVVALGAAIQADILGGGNRELLLLDVVPLTLGIENYGGLMAPLILRNSKIPVSAKETFTTFVDNQTGVDIHVLQGERERSAENRSLAKFKLAGLKPMRAGQARVEVSFLIDADGILQVAAQDLMTGKEQGIEVKPSFGLGESEIEKMLISGLEHAQDDLDFRLLAEAKNKAEPTYRIAKSKLGDARRLLDPAKVLSIETELERLRVALMGSSIETLTGASEKLNQSTIRLAELLVKEAIENQKKERS